MYRATTPTFIFQFPPEASISDASEIYITFAKTNGEELFTKTGADLQVVEDDVAVFLTQQETLKIPPGAIKSQANWIYEEEGRTQRACSQHMTIFCKDNLLDEVIE